MVIECRHLVSLVWQSYLVSDTAPSWITCAPCNASLFNLDTETRQSALPCQGKSCKSILVRVRAESRWGEVCNTCMSGCAKSRKGRNSFALTECIQNLSVEAKCESCCSGLVPVALKSQIERALCRKIHVFNVVFKMAKMTADTKDLWLVISLIIRVKGLKHSV